MKRWIAYILISLVTIFVAGCTHTVEGIQKDTSSVWYGTKEVIYEATEE